MGMFDRVKVSPALTAFNRHIAGIAPAISDAIDRTLFRRPDRASTAVIEEDYLDVDYSASFFVQQGRVFTPLGRRAQRIHFFSSRVSKRQLVDATPQAVQRLRDSYLGYTVLRPVTPPSLGRTFLKVPSDLANLPVFFPTMAPISADLCGISLVVDACPYISQDRLVMACATASLWMASHPLAVKLGTLKYNTSEITALALPVSTPFGPAIGGRGLRLDEEERAFCSMGYDPKLWQLPDDERLKEACYTNLEGGLPSVMNVYFPSQVVDGQELEGLHALTVVGHLMDVQRTPSHEISPGFYSASEFVPAFVVNDDQNGLYLLAEIIPVPQPTQPAVQQNCRAILKLYRASGSPLIGFVCSLLVPFPQRVWLPGTGATRTAIFWLDQLRAIGLVGNNQVVVRTFLVRSNVFKQALLQRSDISDTVKSAYRFLPLPRYVWVVEYGYLSDWQGRGPTSLQIQGEVLLDATLAPEIRAEVLSIHYQGGMVCRRVKQDTMTSEQFQVPDDQPYGCFTLPIRP